MSSNVFCLVSGINFQVKYNKIKVFTINIEKVGAPPKFLSMIGVSCVISTTPIHNTTVANDMAIPLVLVGNISEIITHGIGPREDAKDAM